MSRKMSECDVTGKIRDLYAQEVKQVYIVNPAYSVKVADKDKDKYMSQNNYITYIQMSDIKKGIKKRKLCISKPTSWHNKNGCVGLSSKWTLKLQYSRFFLVTYTVIFTLVCGN